MTEGTRMNDDPRAHDSKADGQKLARAPKTTYTPVSVSQDYSGTQTKTIRARNL